MSNPAPAGDQHGETSREPTDEQGGDPPRLETVSPTLAEPIRKAGFWGAILLPIGYLPVLLTGLSTRFEAGLFLGLVTMHLVALYVGHDHGQ